MKTIAPGTIVFHRFRGYGVILTVNLYTGWVSVRFGEEKKILDINLSSDQLTFSDGEPILFRKNAPDFTPHARLMAMVAKLHEQGYEKLYLYSWPSVSGMYWRWHLFTKIRRWRGRVRRQGWFGNGFDYMTNPVLGWGDAPNASTDDLIKALKNFDPEGLEQAKGQDKEHTLWFKRVCQTLLPNYMYSLEEFNEQQHQLVLKVHPVKQGIKAYDGLTLPMPPGFDDIKNGYFSRI